MLEKIEFFQGVVIARILHKWRLPISIRNYTKPNSSSYVINENTGIYIKYSSKRMSPWRFSFLKKHQDEIYELKNKFAAVYLILVCNDDGVVCISFDELINIIGNQHDSIKWVSVARGRREKYIINGSEGKLHHKIGNSDFPEKIFNSLN